MKKFSLLKYLMLLLVGMSFTLSASAEDYGCLDKWLINVWDYNGTGDDPLVQFRLTPKHKTNYFKSITFNEGQIIITDQMADVVFESDLSSIWKLTYSRRDDSGIQDIVEDVDGMNYQDNAIIFPALKAGSTIAVYAVNGMLVINKSINTDGEYTLPLSSLSQGVYVVNVNGKTFKIVKK
jgi:hypothetical protein